MTRQSVDSSLLISVGYDAKNQVLEVEFKTNGEIWQYSALSQEEYDRMMSAPSCGSYFMRNIRGHFPEKQVV